MEVRPGFSSQWQPLRLSLTPYDDHTMITPTSPEQMLPQNPQDKAAFTAPAAPKPTNTTCTTSTSPHRCASKNLPDVSRTGTAAAVLACAVWGVLFAHTSHLWQHQTSAGSVRGWQLQTGNWRLFSVSCSGPWGWWGFHRRISIQGALSVSCFLISFLPIF